MQLLTSGVINLFHVTNLLCSQISAVFNGLTESSDSIFSDLI